MPDAPTIPPPPERRGRKLVTQVPAIEARAPDLRGPLDPWPEVRPKKPSASDIQSIIDARVAELLSGATVEKPPESKGEFHKDRLLGAAVRELVKQVAPIAATAIVSAVVTVVVTMVVHPSADPAKVDAQATQIKGSDTALIALDTRVKKLESHDSAGREWAQQWAPFELQLWSKLGVKIELPDSYTPIRTVTPAGWARVKAAPIFEVQTSPPLLAKD